jgi:hypothetical protein
MEHLIKRLADRVTASDEQAFAEEVFRIWFEETQGLGPDKYLVEEVNHNEDLFEYEARTKWGDDFSVSMTRPEFETEDGNRYHIGVIGDISIPYRAECEPDEYEGNYISYRGGCDAYFDPRGDEEHVAYIEAYAPKGSSPKQVIAILIDEVEKILDNLDLYREFGD